MMNLMMTMMMNDDTQLYQLQRQVIYSSRKDIDRRSSAINRTEKA